MSFKSNNYTVIAVRVKTFQTLTITPSTDI